MESPVIVENCANFAPPDVENTGFPFDDSDYDSHDHIQARLNDIAQRHPEFASHLRFDDFPSFRRKRHGSGSSTDQDDVRSQAFTTGGPSTSQFGQESRRFGDHAFPSGFNRFPFSSHFEEDFANEPRREEKPPEVPKQQERRSRKPNPYLPQHLSNTVDLGQKQPPVEEARSQRSMSAPPENRTSQSHNTAPRVDNEPTQLPQQQQHPQQQYCEEQPGMGSQFSRQRTYGPREQNPAPPKERIIPISVEGRDEPVMPKNPNIQPSGSAEKVFGNEHVHMGYPQQRPMDPQYHYHNIPPHYEPFVPQGSPSRQQQKQPHHSQRQNYQQQSQPQPQQQQSQPQPQQQPQPQPQQQERPQAPPLSNDPIEKIKSVRADVNALMTQVEKFKGTRKDREYLYLDEMLTRNLLKLDNVETEGKDNIRLARKEAIKCIQTCISNLEARAQAKEKVMKNAEAEERKAAETANPSAEMIQAEQQDASAAQTAEPHKFKSEATLIISGVSKPGVEVKTVEEPKTEETKVAPAVESADKMEVDPALTQNEIPAAPAAETTEEAAKKSKKGGKKQAKKTAAEASTEVTSAPASSEDTTAVLVTENAHASEVKPQEATPMEVASRMAAESTEAQKSSDTSQATTNPDPTQK